MLFSYQKISIVVYSWKKTFRRASKNNIVLCLLLIQNVEFQFAFASLGKPAVKTNSTPPFLFFKIFCLVVLPEIFVRDLCLRVKEAIVLPVFIKV